MELIDLSKEIYHRASAHPTHPPIIVSVWYDHDEKYTVGETNSSSRALSIAFSDHAGTHVDAPAHFDARPDAGTIDQMPLEKFYTSAICLDISHAPLRHAVTVAEMENALEKSGQEIRKGDTVLIYLATDARLAHDKELYEHEFPGLSVEAIHWLADKGCPMFGVEAISPAPEGEENVKAHLVCAERGITHIEGLTNLEKLLGRGRFKFIGFPLKIRGGTGGPMRAVALFD